MRDFRLNGGFAGRKHVLSGVKWGILKEKMRDFWVKWGICEEETRDFRVKWGILED